MKIKIGRQELMDAVNKVKTVVSARSALPILSHILLESRESMVRLSATDLKVSIECSVDCTVEQPGSLTVSSQRLSSMLSELPDAEVMLEMKDNNIIELTCGRTYTKLFSMSPEEFPAVRSFEGIEPLVLTQKVLRRLFTRTSFAICTDQARYNLTGLLCSISSGVITVVATDGRRMSLSREREGIPAGIDVRVIIPGKMIAELERLLHEEGEVQVFIDETQAGFAFDSLRLVTALIEGTFPNYETVIPKRHDKEVQLDTARFTEAVRRTRTMTNEKFNSVRFALSKNTLTLKVVTPEVGEYTEDIPIEYKSEDMEIAFNPDFVLDVARRIDSERLVLVLKDGVSPGLIKPFTEDAESDFVNVIMPIRI